MFYGYLDKFSLADRALPAAASIKLSKTTAMGSAEYC